MPRWIIFPPTCEGCGAPLSETMATGHTARQVFDLPEPSLWSSANIAPINANAPPAAPEPARRFPEGSNAPVQHGARIAALVVYLLHYQLLPEKRLAELMADLFGVIW